MNSNVPFNSNSSVLSVIKETSTAEIPVTGKALVLQPNSIDSFGNSIETATRSPISTSRDAKKGAVVNLTSTVEAPQDLTISAYRYFSEGAMCSIYEGLPSFVLENAKITATGIEIPYIGMDVSLQPKIIASNFKNDENNGEKTLVSNTDGVFVVNDLVPEKAGEGKLTFEYPEITAAIIDVDGKLEYADSAKIPIGASITLSNFATAENNKTFKITDNTGGKITVDGTITAEADPTGDEKAEIVYEIKASISVEENGYRYAVPFLLENMIILCNGYVNANNNGVKVITGKTASEVTVESEFAIVEETPTKATIHCVGYRFPEGEITIDANGAMNVTGTSVGVFSKLKLQTGMGLWIGGLTEESRFDDSVANGLARVASISDNQLIVDKRGSSQHVFVPDDDSSNKQICMYIGEFIRTRPIGSEGYQEPSYTFELKTVNENNDNFYEYSRGNQINTMELGLSTNAIASMSLSTVGTKTDPATTTPMEWTREEPLFQEAFSTPSDVFRMRVQKADEEGLMSVFTNATLAINNNIGTENVIGTLGAYRTSLGQFGVTLTGTAIFMSAEVASAITNNCTVSADFLLENLDGGIYVDIPNMTLSDGSRDFTANEKVKQNITGTAFADEKSQYNYSISSTIFYWLPTNKAELC